MGMVAAKAHHSGNIKSAASPSTVKQIQKILRSIHTFYPRFSLVEDVAWQKFASAANGNVVYSQIRRTPA
jgi:hypothetical protein